MGITNTSQLNRPVYTVDAGAGFDTTLWPASPYQTPDGHQLFFFGGDTTVAEGVGVVPGGDGADGVWHVYTGDVVDVSAPPPNIETAPAQDPTAATSSAAPSTGSAPAPQPTDTTGSGTSAVPAGEPAHVEIDGAGNAQAVTPAGTTPLPAPPDQPASVPPIPGPGNGGAVVTGDGSGTAAAPIDPTAVPQAAESVSAAVDRLKGRLHDLADGVSGELHKLAQELEDLAGNI